MGFRSCSICGLKERFTSRTATKTLFFKFPLNESRCKEWVRMAGDEDLVHLPIEKLHDLRFVCENHFKKRDFTRSKTRLKQFAVPSQNLPAPPLDKIEEFPLKIFKQTLSLEEEHNYNATKNDAPLPTNDAPLPTNDAPLPTNDAPLPTNDAPSSKIEAECIDYISDTASILEITDLEDDMLESAIYSWHKPASALELKDDEQVICEPVDIEETMYFDDLMDYQPQFFTDEDSDTLHQNYKCNECGGLIVGCRYVCVQCPDYDLCAECEGRGAHASHYVLRVPGLRPHAEIQSVLECVRRKLFPETHCLQSEAAPSEDLIDEVKSEPNDAEEPRLSNYEDCNFLTTVEKNKTLRSDSASCVTNHMEDSNKSWRLGGSHEFSNRPVIPLSKSIRTRTEPNVKEKRKTITLTVKASDVKNLKIAKKSIKMLTPPPIRAGKSILKDIINAKKTQEPLAVQMKPDQKEDKRHDQAAVTRKLHSSAKIVRLTDKELRQVFINR